MGLFKRRKEENDGSAEVGSVDEWLLSLDADAKAGAGTGPAADPAGAPAKQIMAETSNVDTLTPPPPQGQPTTGTAPAHDETARSAEDMWHLPDFDVDQNSYVSTDSGLGGTITHTGTDRLAPQSNTEFGEATGQDPEAASPTQTPSEDDLGFQASSPMDFFDMVESPDSPLDNVHPLDQANEHFVHDVAAPVTTAETDPASLSQSISNPNEPVASTLETFGQPHPPSESYVLTPFGDSPQSEPDVLNASLLHPATSVSDPTPVQPAPAEFELASYGAVSSAPNEDALSRWSPDLTPNSDSASFLNDLDENANDSNSTTATGWQPLSQEPFTDADPFGSAERLEPFGLPSPDLHTTTEDHLDLDPFQSTVLETAAPFIPSGPLGSPPEASGIIEDGLFASPDTARPAFDSTNVAFQNADLFENADLDKIRFPKDHVEGAEVPDKTLDTSASSRPSFGAAPATIENPWTSAEDLELDMNPAVLTDDLTYTGRPESAAPLFTSGFEQPSYDLSDFGVVLDSDNAEDLGQPFAESATPTLEEDHTNIDVRIVTPTGDDAATLLAILGLDRHAPWDEVRRTHRSLIADHLAAGESDPERALLARSIRREINTAYAALRLLQLN